jgi:uncharacterized membrane-anchored protein
MDARNQISKVPEVTAVFWFAKILATTLGETGGDALSMSFSLGYALSTGILFVILVSLLAAQISARRYHPALYWAVIVATTTTGTTFSDFLDRTARLGYPLACALLLGAVLLCLASWRITTGSVSVDSIATPGAEAFYWTTILFSNTLGTALGDFASTTTQFGFDGGAVLFGASLLVIYALYRWTSTSRVWLFWTAFILTRPLGATLGDLLTKPAEEGGLNMSRILSSLVLLLAMIAAVVFGVRRAKRVDQGRTAH